MGDPVAFAPAQRPVTSRRRPGLLANAVLAAGLMIFPSQAAAQGKAQKPAETQPQARRQQSVVVGKGDVLSARSGKTTFRLRITGIYRKDLEFAASTREVETRTEGGNKKDYVREWELESSVGYGEEWKPWGEAFPGPMKAVRKGNRAVVLEIKCEEGCPELKKAGKKAPGKRKNATEGSI